MPMGTSFAMLEIYQIRRGWQNLTGKPSTVKGRRYVPLQLAAATRAKLFQLAASFRLPAMLAVPLNSPLQVGFGLADSLLASIVPLVRPLRLSGQGAACQQGRGK